MRRRSKTVLASAVMPTAAQADWPRNWRRVERRMWGIVSLLLLHHRLGGDAGEPEEGQHALVGALGERGIGERGAQHGAGGVAHAAAEEQQVHLVEQLLVAAHLRRLEGRQLE